MTFTDELRDSLDTRIAETKREITALEGALSALRHGHIPHRATASVPAAAAAPSANVATAPRRRGRPRRAAAPIAPAAAPAPAAPAKPAAAEAAAPKPAAAKPAAPKPAAAAKAAKPAPARPGRGAGLTDEKLIEMLGKSAEGLSAISISKQSGAGYNNVLSVLRRLEEAGDVRRTGARRTSLWTRVTDDDRIQARAAELAGRA
jgi:hypothetical protein